MTEIILHSKGEDYTIMIDDEDFDKVSKHTWSISHFKTNKYCYTNIRVNGKYTTMRLHRFIMGLDYSDKRIINHKNGNGLDNRKSNLEICDINYNNQSLNCANKNFGSIYIDKRCKKKKYRAEVNINKKRYQEYFSTPEEGETWLEDMKELAEYLNSPFHS